MQSDFIEKLLDYGKFTRKQLVDLCRQSQNTLFCLIAIKKFKLNDEQVIVICRSIKDRHDQRGLCERILRYRLISSRNGLLKIAKLIRFKHDRDEAYKQMPISDLSEKKLMNLYRSQSNEVLRRRIIESGKFSNKSLLQIASMKVYKPYIYCVIKAFDFSKLSYSEIETVASKLEKPMSSAQRISFWGAALRGINFDLLSQTELLKLVHKDLRSEDIKNVFTKIDLTEFTEDAIHSLLNDIHRVAISEVVLRKKLISKPLALSHAKKIESNSLWLTLFEIYSFSNDELIALAKDSEHDEDFFKIIITACE